MRTIIVAITIAGALLTGCKTKKDKLPVVERDRTVTPAISYSDLFLDSMSMERFITTADMHDSLAQRLRNFYNGRNYQYAWFFKEGATEYASTFFGMYKDYIDYSGDSSLYNPEFQQLFDSSVSGSLKMADSLKLKTELLLTTNFFRYTRRAYQGRNGVDAKELEWFIPRKKIDPAAFLDSMLINKGKNISAYEPVNRQYNLLKEQLLKYHAIEKSGDWIPVAAGKKSYKPDDNDAVLVNIKKHLFLTGDLAAADTTSIFNKDLEAAVRSFQNRYGLKADGSIGTSFIKELNEPLQNRIQQLLINMERIRWMPVDIKTDYLLVNIPEYKLHVYEKGNYAWNMNVVTGSVANSTVVFMGDLKYVVFSPYWNVTPSIIKKEILPGIARNKNYLASHRMEWNNGAVRQLPGPSNSLGLVKFLFPNSYNIYLHDTPSKNLFNESKRAFSHGCIRLGEPKKLAQHLLRNDPAWDSLKITSAMNAGKEKYVTLKETIPVVIGYFTAWVDREGKLNFRDDIYGHDKKMKERLFGKK